MEKERIIIGIDPGTRVMGYGVIKQQQRQVSLLQYGVIHLHQYTTHEHKLKKIFERTLSLMKKCTIYA